MSVENLKRCSNCKCSRSVSDHFEKNRKGELSKHVIHVEVDGGTTTRHSERNITQSKECVISVAISTVLMVGFRPINGLGFVQRVALVGKAALMISTGGY